MSEIFTNLETGEVLEFTEDTLLFSAPGIFDLKKTREYTAGKIGGAIPLSSTVSQKVFSLIFKSSDSEGIDQMKIKMFFGNSDKYFRIQADWLKDNYVDFTVVEASPIAFGNNEINITCQARFGDFVNENRILITERQIAASSSASWTTFTQTFANGFSTPAEIVLTLTTPETVTWKPNIAISMRKGSASTGLTINSLTGAYDQNGTLIAPIGNKYELNSYSGVESGNGIVVPGGTTYWRLEPGESASIYIGAFTRPISANGSTINAKLESISVQQKQIF